MDETDVFMLYLDIKLHYSFLLGNDKLFFDNFLLIPTHTDEDIDRLFNIWCRYCR